MPKNKNILIVEDDQRIADNISKGLNEKGYHTQIAFDGQMALKFFKSGSFDLIILDLNLPVLNGYEVAKAVRNSHENIPIIMLTALGETDDKLEGFARGADDYMVKPFDFRELVVRLELLLKRKSSNIHNKQLKVADLVMDLDRKTVERDGKPIDLTPKEFSLLEYLINHQGHVVSKAEIASEVWNQSPKQSLNVVEVYINFLRKKIDKSFSSSLIHTKSGMGYYLEQL